MKASEATALLQNAVTGHQPQHWADLGCGGGTFTLALRELLPPGSHLTAVDRQIQAVPNFIKASFEKDELPLTGLDGILMANSLHYIHDKSRLIRKLENYCSAYPTFLIIEYNISHSNRWVPYPINYPNLQKLFGELGYRQITKLAEIQSRFGGNMYSALIRL